MSPTSTFRSSETAVSRTSSLTSAHSEAGSPRLRPKPAPLSPAVAGLPDTISKLVDLHHSSGWELVSVREGFWSRSQLETVQCGMPRCGEMWWCDVKQCSAMRCTVLCCAVLSFVGVCLAVIWCGVEGWGVAWCSVVSFGNGVVWYRCGVLWCGVVMLWYGVAGFCGWVRVSYVPRIAFQAVLCRFVRPASAMESSSQFLNMCVGSSCLECHDAVWAMAYAPAHVPTSHPCALILSTKSKAP